MADPSKEPVQAVPFNFTKYTGVGATAGVAVAAALPAILEALGEAPDPRVVFGMLLAAGLFGVALAVCAAADVLARAYVTSHTTPDPKDATKAIPASIVLAEAVEQQNEAMKKQSEEARVVAMPRIKGVKVQGAPVTLLALRTTGDKAEFQVKQEGETELTWVDPVAVEFPK